MPQITNYKEIIKKKKFVGSYFRTVKNWVNFVHLVNLADCVSNSKQRKHLIQNLFQNIFQVKVVQNRAQNIRKMRQFYTCITNCFMAIQNRVIFLNLCNSALCLLCYVSEKCLQFKYLFSKFLKT